MFTEAEHQTQNTVMDKEIKKQSEYTLHIQQINNQKTNTARLVKKRTNKTS